MSLRILKTRQLFKNPFMEVKEVHFFRKDEKAYPQVLIKHAPSVRVLAFDNNQLYLVKSKAEAVGRELLGLIMTLLEDTDSPDSVVKKTLENYGFEIGSLEALGAVYLSPDHSDEQCWLYLAKVEPLEVPELVTLPLTALEALTASCEDASLLLTLQALSLRRLRSPLGVG